MGRSDLIEERATLRSAYALTKHFSVDECAYFTVTLICILSPCFGESL
jgi:hypothetical protein